MSRSHTVQQGDTLSAIASRYYGIPAKWTDIRDGNPQLLGRKTAIDGSPLIYPGDVLIIPEESELAPELNTKTPIRLCDDVPDDFSIMIDGKTFSAFTNIELSESIDSFDTFTLGAPFDNSVQDQRDAFSPYTYKGCAVYYDRHLVFNGQLLTPNPSINPESRSIALQGYPLCGVLNDCALPDTKYPPEYNGKRLTQIAQDMAGPFGVKVVLDGDEGAPFDEVSYEPGNQILSFLSELAKQRGLLITNNEQGNLLFWNAKDSKPSAVFHEEDISFISCEPSFDPQKFYSHITGYSKTDKNSKHEKYTYENKYLTGRGVLRPHSFVVQDGDGADLEKAVLSYTGRMFGSSVSYKLTIAGHRDVDGLLYKKNTSVSVLSPGAMIYRETKLLIKRITRKSEGGSGDVTVFDLVLPGSYSGELPGVMPWEE